MRSGFETMARIGYAARGIVYFIVGTFATLAAFGGQQPVGTKGALEKLLSTPFGGILLVILAAGLICFAVWRFAQALLDADRHGRSGKALALRTIYAGNGLFYFGLAVWSVSLMLTLRGGAGTEGYQLTGATQTLQKFRSQEAGATLRTWLSRHIGVVEGAEWYHNKFYTRAGGSLGLFYGW